jgi:hypothetical protein
MTNTAKICKTGVKGVDMIDERSTNLGVAECDNSSSASEALQRCLIMAENTSAEYSVVSARTFAATPCLQIPSLK